MNPKTAAREYAIQFLFSYDLEEDSALLDRRLEEFNLSYNEPDKEQPNITLDPAHYNFCLTLIEGVVENSKTIIDEISKSLKKGKTINSIEKIDLKILMLAFFEMNYSDSAPQNVVINEAVNIAKKYSTKDSYLFINGLLGKLNEK